MWSGFIWLRLGLVAGCYENDNVPWLSLKDGRIFLINWATISFQRTLFPRSQFLSCVLYVVPISYSLSYLS